MYNKTELSAIVENLLGSGIDRFDFIEGGSNNILAKAGNRYVSFVVKVYFYDEQDRRDRLNVEYSILSFLWENGVRCIPEPIAVDWDKKIAIYRFIEGSKPDATTIKLEDVLCLSSLLHDMWDLRSVKRALELPVASDACFSLSDYMTTVENRFNKLHESIKDDNCGKAALQFLKNDFYNFFVEEQEKLNKNNDYSVSIPQSMRTLSPSDVGFINAIKTPQNKCIFFDFEYAGWDDPAKMIADVIHHPGVPIPDNCRQPFVEDALTWLGDSGEIASRLGAVIPAVGLKWCLIILNEFESVSRKRRKFARTEGYEEDIRWQQLEKAKLKLDQVKQGIVDNLLLLN